MFPRRHSHSTVLLETIPLFGGLGRRHLDLIGGHADQVALCAGAVWSRHSRIPREVLLVLDGMAQAEGGGGVIGRLGAGDIFGDIELVDRERRIERVIAETPLTLLVIEARSLSYLRRAIPELQARLPAPFPDPLRHARAPQTDSIALPDHQTAIQRPVPIAGSKSTSS